MSIESKEGSGDAEEPSHLSSGFLVGGGRYTLLREIARGGMGVIWLAHDERLSEPLALKFLSSTVRNDAAELARLRQETQKSRKLTHANIIRIYDLYEAPGEPAFISMEYVNGPNLWEAMTQQPNGVFAWEDLKPLVKQLCDALAYAHGERVIHRDLKPTNLMLAENKRLKLADFGLAAVAMQVDPASVERSFGGGTLTHMSPQQLQGEVAAVTDDIYSLGATLYDLLCGQPPFYEGNIRYQLLNNVAPPLQERLAALREPNDVPTEAVALIMACLAKDPAKRPQSASAVAERIGLVEKPAEPPPIPAPRVVIVPKDSVLEEEPPRNNAWLAVALIAVLACVGFVLWFKRSPPSPPTAITAPVPSNTIVNANPVEPSPSNEAAAPTNAMVAEPVSTYPFEVLPFEPLAYWPLNETAGPNVIDIVHGFDGVCQNVVLGAPSHDTVEGKNDPSARAALFGSVGSAPSLILTPTIDLSKPKGGNGEFSITAWVKPNALNKRGMPIVSKGFGQGDEQFCLDGKGDGATFRFFVRDASGTSHHADSSIAPDNNWHFLAGVCDQANARVTLYMDGKEVAQSKIAPGTGIHASAQPLVIGARKSGRDTPYDLQYLGALDNVAIFTNALSAEQVLSLYQAVRKPAVPPGQSLLDLTFDAGLGPDGEINDLLMQPDGGILVAGRFNSFNGVMRRGLVRLRNDGKLDFQKPDVYGTIDSMALQPDGKIVIAGDFNAVNGIMRPRIARLEPNLAVDPLFYAGEGPDGEVFSVVMDKADIFLAGAFQHIGPAALSGVARLDAAGHVDPAFQIGPGTDRPVFAAALPENGKMVIGGDFHSLRGAPIFYFGGLLGNGRISNVYRHDVKGGPVRAIVIQPNGMILFAGDFKALRNTELRGIARLHGTGKVDSGFNPGKGADRRIDTIAVQRDGKIIVGGEFTTFDGVPRDHLARLNPDGSLDPAFDPRLNGAKVRKVLVQPDGKILVAGLFTSVDGVGRNKLARLKPSASIK